MEQSGSQVTLDIITEVESHEQSISYINEIRSVDESVDATTVPPLQGGVTYENGSFCCDSVSVEEDSCDNRAIMAEWTKGFHHLIDEAPYLKSTVVSGSCYAGSKEEVVGFEGVKCDWLDHDLLEEGRKFVRRNFFSIFLAHFIGIAFLLTVRPIQSLLLRTSALHKKEYSLRSYVKLIVYLKHFYESPSVASDFSPSSSSPKSDECTQSISRIYEIQKNAARNFRIYVPPPREDLKLTGQERETYEAIREDTSQITGICSNTKFMPKILYTVNPEVPLSQYDLVIIQYAFSALVAQFPQIFGIYETSNPNGDGNRKGLDGFIHLWGVLGHIFGIEERFNLCLNQNFDLETNQMIFKQVFLFSFKTINESAMRLWRSMTSGSSRHFFFFRTRAMILFMCKNVAQLKKCKSLYAVMTPSERFSYYAYKFIIGWILWVPPFRIVLNYSLRASVDVCHYFLTRSKKCESGWNSSTTICATAPVNLKTTI